MHFHWLHHHHLSWCSSSQPYSTINHGSVPPAPATPTPLSCSSQVDRLASAKSIYTHRSSPPPFHRLLFLLSLILVTWWISTWPASLFYVFYTFHSHHLHLPWINIHTLIIPTSYTNMPATSNLCIQPCSRYPIISLNATCSTLNLSALSRLFN